MSYNVTELNWFPRIINVTLRGVVTVRPNNFNVDLELNIDHGGNVTTSLVIGDSGHSESEWINFKQLVLKRMLPDVQIHASCFWDNDGLIIDGRTVWCAAMTMAIIDIEQPKVELSRKGGLLSVKLAFSNCSYSGKTEISFRKVSKLIIPTEVSDKKRKRSRRDQEREILEHGDDLT